MPGDVGLVAGAVEVFAKFFLSEEGYGEFKVRRTVEEKRRELVKAVQTRDWAHVRAVLPELERLSNKA